MLARTVIGSAPDTPPSMPTDAGSRALSRWAVAASIGYLSARRSQGEGDAGDGGRSAPPPRHDGAGGRPSARPLPPGAVPARAAPRQRAEGVARPAHGRGEALALLPQHEGQRPRGQGKRPGQPRGGALPGAGPEDRTHAGFREPHAPVTSAPYDRAGWIANVPAAPDGPLTGTRCPAWIRP